MARYATTAGPEGQRCDRCGKVAIVLTGSYFNEGMICPSCEEKERAHPDFERARKAEEAACKQGNYNFEGIGLPADLR